MTNKFEPTVAVTGAAGFLGGVIVRTLVASGVRVHRIARSSRTAVPGTVRHGWDPDRDAGPPAQGLQVDAVIDCAAALPSRVENPDALKSTNARLVQGAIDLAARKGGRLIYMSSQAVYGRPHCALIDADTPLAPATPYGESKQAAERAVAAAVDDERLAGAAVLRLPAVVGCGAHDNFPAAAAATLLRGEPVTVFNPQSPYNAVVDAETLAVFAALLAKTIDGFVAVSPATHPPITVVAAVEAIAAGLGCKPSLRFREAPHGAPIIDPGPAIALGMAPQSPASVLCRFGKMLASEVHCGPERRTERTASSRLTGDAQRQSARKRR